MRNTAAAKVAGTRRDRRQLWLAAALALGSVAFRAQHLGWGLPDLEEEALPLKKAFEMCGWGTGELRLDPDTAGWPSLSFYLHMAVQQVHYFVGHLSGAFADRQDYFLQQLTWTPVAVIARAVGVAAAGLVVFVGARLGGRLAGRGGLLLSGAVLAVSPLLTRHAQYITPDIILTGFTALALAGLVTLHDRGRRRDYVWVGIWIGLGVSTKYTPVLLLPALYLAHLLRRRREGAANGRGGLNDRRPWLALAACVLAFVATSPYVLADVGVLLRDVDYQVAHMQGGHFGHESQAPGLIFYARDVLAPGLGWPAFILGATGLVAAAWRRRGAWWVVLTACVVYYVAMALMRTRFDRYVLPDLLPLALGVAGWWAVGAAWLAQRGRWPVPVVLIAALLVACLPGARASAGFLAQQGRPGTLQLAKDWLIDRLAGRDAFLAMEAYTPAVPRYKHLALRRQDPAYAHLNPEQRRRWLDIAPMHVVYLPFYTTRHGAGDFYYDLRHYQVEDYVVTSSAVKGRYQRAPERYPQQVAFYDDLARLAPAEVVFAPEGRRRGPEISIHAITDETRRRLASEKPPLVQADFRRVADRIVGPHFREFINSIAEHALARGRPDLAAVYYQPLYESTPPDQRLTVLPAYAFALVQAQRWSQAEPLLRRWRQLAPTDPRAAGYLGTALGGLGRPDEAREEFAACVALAGAAPEHAELAAWARSRLAAPGGE